MLFPAKIEQQDDGVYVVSFRDIPEALTQGYSLDEAKELALDALITALSFYYKDKRVVPMPSKALDGEYVIDLPVSMWAKVLLLNTMLEQNISQSVLAMRLNKGRQEMQRIIDIHHITKIETLIDALKHLGKQPKFSVE